MKFADAHCHVPRDAAPAECAVYLKDFGAVFLNGTSPADWPQVAEFAQTGQSCGVVPFFGIHPWWCETWEPDWMELLEQTLDSARKRFPRFGIGEIGLDTCRRQLQTPERVELQKNIFQKQLQLAVDARLPVVIHNVHAWDWMVPLLHRTVGRTGLPLLFHAYGSSPELIAQLGRFRAFFSFAQVLRTSNVRRFTAQLRAVPPDRFLLETDEDTFSAVCQIPHFYTEVAQLLEMDVNSLQLRVFENCNEFLSSS